MIETRYDTEADVLRVRFGPSDSVYDGAQEVAPGIYVEFGADGRPIGVEVTSVRWLSQDISPIEAELASSAISKRHA